MKTLQNRYRLVPKTKRPIKEPKANPPPQMHWVRKVHKLSTVKGRDSNSIPACSRWVVCHTTIPTIISITATLQADINPHSSSTLPCMVLALTLASNSPNLFPTRVGHNLLMDLHFIMEPTAVREGLDMMILRRCTNHLATKARTTTAKINSNYMADKACKTTLVARGQVHHNYLVDRKEGLVRQLELFRARRKTINPIVLARTRPTVLLALLVA